MFFDREKGRSCGLCLGEAASLCPPTDHPLRDIYHNSPTVSASSLPLIIKDEPNTDDYGGYERNVNGTLSDQERRQDSPEGKDAVDSKSELAFILGQSEHDQFSDRPTYPGCQKCNETIVKFKCFHCSHETKWKFHLRRHIKRVHPIEDKETAICTACGKSFRNKFCLKEHQEYCEKWNIGILKYKCDFCYYETKRKYYMNNHIRRVHSFEAIDRSTCTACGKYCRNKYSLKAHLRFCEKSNNKIVKFECFYCSHKTKWKYYLNKHIRRVHPVEALERTTCTACGKYYKNNDSLKEHKRYYCEKSNNDLFKHKCQFCQYETKRKPNLNTHMRRVHSVAAIERSTCGACGKCYTNKKCLREHTRFCDKFNCHIVKFKCFHCFHETKRKCDLRSHIKRLHPVGPDRPTCTGCRKSFKNKKTLKKHRRICEKSNKKIVKYRCFHCSHETKWKFHLRAHIKRVHPVGAKECSTCPACGKYYKNKYCLKEHQRYCEKANIGIFKHKCEFCQYETKRKPYLNNHIRRVHSIGTIDHQPAPVCPACGKYCRNKYSLKAHIRFCDKSNDNIVKFECFYCSHKTKWKYHLSSHIHRVHPVGGVGQMEIPNHTIQNSTHYNRFYTPSMWNV